MKEPVQVTCGTCGNVFEKAAKEYKRQTKKNPNRKWFCTRSCAGAHLGSNLGNNLGNPKNLQPGAGRSKDEYSPFRYFIRKARSRRHDCSIDVQYVKKLWEDQEGKCAITGLPLVLHASGWLWEKDTGNPWKPSLDRINSSEGYVKGNVRFVCLIANLAMQSWSDDVLYKFCKAATEYNMSEEGTKVDVTHVRPPGTLPMELEGMHPGLIKALWTWSNSLPATNFSDKEKPVL
jgi:hypothetical protein